MSRVCSECPTPLTGKSDAKTCSSSCRAKRHRRIAAGRASGRDVSRLVEDEAEQVAKDVLREELTPVVRESLTEDVLAGIARLVQLTPQAVAAVEADLTSTDDKIRQDAYKTIFRHTVGQAALVPNVEEDKSLTVYLGNFPQPDPDAPKPFGPAPLPLELEQGATRVCDTCGNTKSQDQFVANSDRCIECYDAIRERAKALARDNA